MHLCFLFNNNKYKININQLMIKKINNNQLIFNKVNFYNLTINNNQIKI